MCRATKYLESIQSILEQAQRDYQEVTAQQADADKRLSEFYHRLETATFNVVNGYKLAKELQGILLERRAVKDELYALRSFNQNIVRNAKLDQSVKTAAKTIAKYGEVPV